MAAQCERKIALMEEAKKAMAALIELQNRELEVLLADDFDQIESIDSRIEAARARKASLIELFRGHVASHGC